jgi:hypothetical protein
MPDGPKHNVIGWLLERPMMWLDLPKARKVDLERMTWKQYRQLEDLAQEAIANGLYPERAHPITEIMRALFKQVRHTRKRYISR